MKKKEVKSRFKDRRGSGQKIVDLTQPIGNAIWSTTRGKKNVAMKVGANLGLLKNWYKKDISLRKYAVVACWNQQQARLEAGRIPTYIVSSYLYSVSSHEFDASAYFQKTRVKANSLQTNSSSSPHIRIHRFRCYWGERGGRGDSLSSRVHIYTHS